MVNINEKRKKQLMMAIIVIFGIIILYLWLQPKPMSSGGLCSNPSTSSGTDVTNTCDDGGRFKCHIVCDRTPPLTTYTFTPRPDDSPTDGNTCRTYSTSKGYMASAWDSSIDSITGCQNWVLNHACSVPTKIDVINNCCMWTC